MTLVHSRTIAATATARTPEKLAEGTPPPSPAGPVDEGTPVRMPPARDGSALTQSLRFVFGPMRSTIRSRQELGDVWQLRLLSRSEPFVVTTHPEHVKSLFTAKPDEAPSLTGESPLRPILGPDSVLTSVGDRHMRQRKMLLPAFHGDAVQRYVSMIEDVTAREIDTWPVDKPFALAPRMQAITLDVIMSGIFGIGTNPPRRSIERRLRDTIRRMLLASTNPVYQLVELQQAGRAEPRGVLRAVLNIVDRQMYQVIRARRAAGPGGDDVLSMLLEARDEDGQALSDSELRDELMSLVLAGHETTANSLAWTLERMLRRPETYERLRESVRAGEEEYVEATIYEGMRVRPVIPFIVRMAKRPWQLGEYVVPRNTPIAVSIVALHHREDVYPDPFAFRPERFLEQKAGTYTWIPFGGGIRRCLGAALAMAEQRVVLREVARRTDMRPAKPDPESPRQRNVTMIPNRGGRVVISSKQPV